MWITFTEIKSSFLDNRPVLLEFMLENKYPHDGCTFQQSLLDYFRPSDKSIIGGMSANKFRSPRTIHLQNFVFSGPINDIIKPPNSHILRSRGKYQKCYFPLFVKAIVLKKSLLTLKEVTTTYVLIQTLTPLNQTDKEKARV